MSTDPASRAYAGPRDVGRAESLYRSALTKTDPDYAAQLLFSALSANPEHGGAFAAVLERAPALAARRRAPRVADVLAGGPADDFLRALAGYAGGPTPEQALACAAEAVKAGLFAHAAALGGRALAAFESGAAPAKAPRRGPARGPAGRDDEHHPGRPRRRLGRPRLPGRPNARRA
jgi:L-alanine-DL-glutamate epimerase-like enolase superfamily enzyme